MDGFEEFRRLLDEAGAAKVLGISVITLRRAVKARKIGVTIVGSRRRFTAANIEEYLRNGSVKACAPIKTSSHGGAE